MQQFNICGSKSRLAARIHNAHQISAGKPPNFFFWDLEQIAAGHKVHGLSAVGKLTSEWRGHPVGSLVMVTYEGVSLHQLTHFVAKP